MPVHIYTRYFGVKITLRFLIQIRYLKKQVSNINFNGISLSDARAIDTKMRSSSIKCHLSCVRNAKQRLFFPQHINISLHNLT
jgi:hypothetical protein